MRISSNVISSIIFHTCPPTAGRTVHCPACPKHFVCASFTAYCSNYMSVPPIIPEFLKGKGHVLESMHVYFPGANIEPDTAEHLILHGRRLQPRPKKEWMSLDELHQACMKVPGLSFIPNGTLNFLPLRHSGCLRLSPHPPVQTLRKRGEVTQ